MVVDVFIRENSGTNQEEGALPDTILGLEMIYKEVELTVEKLMESTDLLTEEFRKSEGDGAREYYEYIQENLEILKLKREKMKAIKEKMNSIRGVFAGSIDKASTGSGAGGLMDLSESQGHFI
jgi:hypothetical protein